MKDHDDKDRASPDSASLFPATRWSLILAAQNQNSPMSAAALNELCRSYLGPIYVYIRGRGKAHHDAEDLTQEFISSLLRRNSIADLSAEKGRFRSFLRVSIKHFLADDWDKKSAQKRGGEYALVSLELAAEEGFLKVLVDRLDPETLYEWRWALTLIEKVLQRLQVGYAEAGKAELFAALQPLIGKRDTPQDCERIAGRLGMTAGAVRVALHRMLKRYGTLLRQEVRETVSDPADVEDEIHHLLSVLDVTSAKLIGYRPPKAGVARSL
jgi:RNA polymerase sigma-70 factor (ECF subfamily)